MHPLITSTQNPRIKKIYQLSKTRNRKKENLFVIEGLREIKKAMISGYSFTSVFFCPVLMNRQTHELISQLSHKTEIFEVEKHVYEKIAYRDNHDGIIIEAIPKFMKTEDLKLKDNPLLLVLEKVEKPGNLGAIFRTADAAGLDAILICDLQTDLYNPNVIRSSLGCVFTVPFVICSSDDAINFLRNNKIDLIATTLQADKLYTEINFKKPSAIILGSEAEGLTDIWRKNADQKIKIPMAGESDSLNVSVTAGIMIFEALRQRK